MYVLNAATGHSHRVGKLPTPPFTPAFPSPPPHLLHLHLSLVRLISSTHTLLARCTTARSQLTAAIGRTSARCDMRFK